MPERVQVGEARGDRHGAGTGLACRPYVERRVAHEHRGRRLAVACRGALAGHRHEVGAALVRVGAVGADLEVEPALEPEALRP